MFLSSLGLGLGLARQRHHSPTKLPRKRNVNKVVPLVALAILPSCVSSYSGSASSAEICRQLGANLPTRSHEDTLQTQDEIQRAYAAFALTCPDWVHLIPE